MIRAMIAEDSAVTRMYLEHMLRGDGELDIVALASNGLQAVELAQSTRPDVILMDVHMPKLDGYEATREIMRVAPIPIVMVTASSSELGTQGGFRALEAGALMLVEKPPGLGDPGHEQASRELVRTLKLMAEVKVVRRWRMREPAAGAPRPDGPMATPRVLAIGASTGGPPIVAELLRALPDTLATPVLVVQHIGEGFVAGFADWLGAATPRPVRIAHHLEPTEPGIVYIGAGDAHLGFSRDGRILLEDAPPNHGFRPSITNLFTSVARNCGPAAIGILLTGMGRDGADGLLAMRSAGALTIAQDEASSVIYGMPREAVRLGAARHVLPPVRIAELLRSLNGSRAHA